MNKTENLQRFVLSGEVFELVKSSYAGIWRRAVLIDGELFVSDRVNLAVNEDLQYFLNYYEVRSISELPKLTQEEKDFLQYYPQDWWIARDDIGGALYIYDSKPFKKFKLAWGVLDGHYEQLRYCPPFANIKWSNDNCYTIGELRK